jgi:hypothetical protein
LKNPKNSTYYEHGAQTAGEEKKYDCECYLRSGKASVKNACRDFGIDINSDVTLSERSQLSCASFVAEIIRTEAVVDLVADISFPLKKYEYLALRLLFSVDLMNLHFETGWF